MDAEKRVSEFLKDIVKEQYGVIIEMDGRTSPMYTSSTRAIAFIMQDGAGIPSSGGVLHQLVPWSDDDISITWNFNSKGVFYLT